VAQGVRGQGVRGWGGQGEAEGGQQGNGMGCTTEVPAGQGTSQPSIMAQQPAGEALARVVLAAHPLVPAQSGSRTWLVQQLLRHRGSQHLLPWGCLFRLLQDMPCPACKPAPDAAAVGGVGVVLVERALGDTQDPSSLPRPQLLLPTWVHKHLKQHLRRHIKLHLQVDVAQVARSIGHLQVWGVPSC
jgi:hypothetical protein